MVFGSVAATCARSMSLIVGVVQKLLPVNECSRLDSSDIHVSRAWKCNPSGKAADSVELRGLRQTAVYRSKLEMLNGTKGASWMVLRW
jgi:hypothetical protein